MKKNNFLIYFLSFIIPVIISALAYLNIKIFPGGSSTLLSYDMKCQLLALYGYLSNGGPGFDSLFHNMSGGLGGGFLGTFALYLSPFDLVYAFVPTVYLADAIYIMTILRIGFSGLFCSLYIKKSNVASASCSNLICVLFSCCYALMSYSFMYAMSPMWLDFVMFLPLLALFCEKLVSGKKSLGFVLLLSFSMISNYYMAYMTSIALLIYFLFRIVEEGCDRHTAFKRFIGFALSGILSAGLSCFILIPVVLDFRRGKFAEDISGEKTVLFKNSLFDVLSVLKPSSYTTLDYYASPNIFCGSVVLLMVVLWLVAGKKNVRSRIAGGVVILFYFLSFMLGPLDRAWHGFRNPVGFPVRYAFTFVFFMILFALRGYKKFSEFNLEKYKSILGLLGAVAVLYTFFELYINGAYILSRLAVEARYSNRDEYMRVTETIEGVIDLEESLDTFDYSRTVKNYRYSRFDGALYGYDGLARFTSSYNFNLSALLSRIGVGTSFHTITEFGITPPVASLIDMGYYVSWHKDLSDYYDLIGEYRGFELYRNPNRLPLVFSTELDEDVVYKEFEDVPFENINILFSEISGIDDLKIYEQEDYVEVYRDPEDYYEENTLGFADYVLTPETDGYYWFVSEYVDTQEEIYKADQKNGEFSTIRAYAEYFINDNLMGTYRTDEFTYCNDMGYLKGGQQYLLSLDTSMSEIGKTYIYRYNDELAKTVYDMLASGGYVVNEINSRCIKATGVSDKDSYLFISLPYEDGYKIYVDGNRCDYTSYRDSFLLVKVPAGEHEIVIRYMPPGFALGLLISVIALMLIIALIIGDRRIGDHGKEMD